MISQINSLFLNSSILKFLFFVLFSFKISSHTKHLKSSIAYYISVILLYISSFYITSVCKSCFSFLIYLLSLPQLIRMRSFSRIYIKMRVIRIETGPIFGIILLLKAILFEEILIFLSFITYLIGVCFKPTAESEKYFVYRKLHGMIMIVSFGFVVVNDLFLN